MRTLLSLLPLLAALGCSSEASSDDVADSFPDAAYETLASDSGALFIEIRTAPVQPPERGLTSVEYRVADASGAPVTGLSLAVVPWMPDMGHGASTSPEAAEKGPGRYVVSGVSFFMPGEWELRTAFSGPVDDGATPKFQVP